MQENLLVIRTIHGRQRHVLIHDIPGADRIRQGEELIEVMELPPIGHVRKPDAGIQKGDRADVIDIPRAQAIGIVT